jgi:hypothetical protein
MAYHKVEHKSGELQDLRINGWVRGENTGFAPLDEICSLKKGYPFFVAGAPHSGKTELIIEILLNTSVLHGWKHFIYLGENGEVEEVIAELCFKYICKPYKSASGYSMSDSERVQAEMFINDHFVFCDDSQDMRLSDFYTLCSNAEKEYKINFDTTLFDPFNDAIDESVACGGTHHWLNRELKMVRKVSKSNNRIDILINHIADVKTSIDKESGKAYLRPALPNEWNGGRTWWRRGFLMVLVYVPPPWLKDDNGMEYGENVSLVYIQKAKPKGVAKYGKVARLNWNWKNNRYSWSENNSDKYAFMINQPEFKESKIEPNFHF